ncbi:hypothetical protein GCM10022248_67770 [Nonomuraea soli]
MALEPKQSAGWTFVARFLDVGSVVTSGLSDALSHGGFFRCVECAHIRLGYDPCQYKNSKCPQAGS